MSSGKMKMKSFIGHKCSPFICAVLLLCLFPSGISQSTPTLSQFVSQDALEGTTVELQCNVTNKGNYDLFWHFVPETGDEDVLIGDGNFAPTYRRSRFSIVSDTAAGQYNLKITNVKIEDAGLYTCTLAESGIKSVSSGRLTVLQPTPPLSGPVCNLTTLAFKEGEYINGTCSESPGGITSSSLQWFDGRDISVTPVKKGQSNILRMAHERDDGVKYKCRETHTALEKPRYCFVGPLVVLHEPRVVFYHVDKTAELGSNATLTCRTTSNPAVQEARLFVNDSRVYITNNSVSERSSVDSRFSLTLKDTEKGKDLVFTIHGFKQEDYLLSIFCQAWNEEGARNQTTMFEIPVPTSGGSNLYFIIAVDVAALVGVIVIVACILMSKPVCAKLCGNCKSKRNSKD